MSAPELTAAQWESRTRVCREALLWIVERADAAVTGHRPALASCRSRAAAALAATDGEARSAVDLLVTAVQRLTPWVAKGISDGAYVGCALPNEAAHAVAIAEVALGLAGIKP